MVKTYYCDYCDRSFKDDVEARKKHLSSMQHMTNRASHYSTFKDPETILKEEYCKTPCKRYMTIGDCAFGSGCRFSHYTPPMIWELQQLAAMKKSKVSIAQPKDGWPNSEDIIKEYFENVIDSSDTEDLNHLMWNTPSKLIDYPYLPPSLQPIISERMMDCNFTPRSDDFKLYIYATSFELNDASLSSGVAIIRTRKKPESIIILAFSLIPM